jgi:hypothetical protein
MQADDAASKPAAMERQLRVLLELCPVQDEPQARTESYAVEDMAPSDADSGEVDENPSWHRTGTGSQEVHQQAGYLLAHRGLSLLGSWMPRVPTHSEIRTQHVDAALRLSVYSVGIPLIRQDRECARACYLLIPGRAVQAGNGRPKLIGDVPRRPLWRGQAGIPSRTIRSASRRNSRSGAMIVETATTARFPVIRVTATTGTPASRAAYISIAVPILGVEPGR